MGIKDFTKVFSGKETKLKNYKDKVFIVDAMVEIYRAALGMDRVKGLTDKDGNPTLHISVIRANVIKMQALGIEQMWVFDFNSNGVCHNAEKFKELEKRRSKRNNAKKEIETLQSMLEKDVVDFSSDDELDKADKKCNKDVILSKIAKQEKRAFHVSSSMINDIKFLLDGFGVKWTEAPEGYESEQIAAMLTNYIPNSLVLTSDADALLFGARSILKKNIRTKKYTEYVLSDILSDKDIKMDDLIKVGVVLGSDFAPKTPRVGPKTVLKKLYNIELTLEQNKAVEVFNRKYDVKLLKWSTDKEAFVNNNIHALIDWLVECKSFNKNSTIKIIRKVIDLKDID